MRIVNNTKKCIDCNASVPRRVLRCPSCRKIALKNRPTYKRTSEHKIKMSQSTKGKPKPGLKGKKRPIVAEKIANAWTEEMKEAARQRGKEKAQDKEWLLKIANALSGEKNPRWQGGIANQKYAPGFGKTLKRLIRERDNFTCQLCGITEAELSYNLSVHHADYDKTNHNEDNLFSTCKRCNSLINANRDVWYWYFIALSKTRQLGQNVSNFIDRKIITQREGFIITTHL